MIVTDLDILHRSSTEARLKEGQDIGRKLIKEFKVFQETHKDLVVVGLAAPQIGLNKRVFFALGEVFINPKPINFSTNNSVSYEGCCSLDGCYEVRRLCSLSMRWINGAGQLCHKRFEGNMAAIMFHELDHLDGKLISDIGTKVEKPPTMKSK